ncbi:putative disease resistance RPP13-like protein 1 [Pyrus x bretschneideri]|uniref:putative disease resistance RPP13-like protein 1 n=1 Tax=Pyrus x bretschneideri TaxID=225117 RepID=UPI00203028E9|nr:putative disease resistance RPP13-like protein 1 [Pyrus x bretschneideri]
MEEIGNEYFDILLQSSLFQDASMSDSGIVSKCKMHDLVHNLAELVSKSESLTGDFCGIYNTNEIRHVARVATSMLDKIPETSAKKLRSVFFDDGEVPSNIFPRFNALRVLNLCNANIEKFPISAGRLKHLSLQTLPYFSVGNETGSRIEELAGLKQLKGELILCNMEHVKNGEEAKKAELEDKRQVCHLSFKWTEDRSTTHSNEEENVLEGLRPHPELESLSIKNFMVDKFPSWMMGKSLLLNNLKKIQLLGCDKCEGVPLLGHLPNLTELKISGMANFKCIGVEFYGYDLVNNVATTSKEIITLFPTLKILYILKCNNLIEWMKAPMMSTKKVVVFYCLEMLTINSCSKLRNAPDVFGSCGSLQRLVIRSCEKLRHLPNGLDTLPLLEELNILGCPSLDCERLSSLPSGLEYCISLQKLRIRKYYGVASSPVHTPASLRQLDFSNCDGLSGPLGVWASLVELNIFNCNVTSFEIEGGVSLASLKKLTIDGCDESSSVPALPQQCPFLHELYIWNCPKLASL